jgi:uncharacterized protein YdbL (DUF1318 family)
MENAMTTALTRATLAVSALALALTGALTLGAAPPFAQRDPVYEAARQAGTVGEKPDGYLGVVRGADATVKKMVDDLNIKRRALYAQKAQAASATLEEYALTAGCLALARTTPGEKDMTPQGAWQTRTSAPPIRDSRCP